MSDIRLSIIIPVYNVEAYLAQCLDSVYRQDIPEDEYEVICVDDCSPDNSLNILESYASIHNNMTIIKNAENRKLGGARNAGMDVATGRYVMFIDSDDFVDDNVLGRLCSIAEQDDLDVLHFDYEVFPEKKNLRKVGSTEIMTGPDMFFDKRFIWFHDLVTAWRKLYKRTFLLENRISFAEHIMFEDNDYAILVFANALKVRHTQINAYHYRNNPDSITRAGCSSKHISYWMDLCHRLVKIKEHFIEQNKDIRFQKVLGDFIRYEIHHVLDSTKSCEQKYKVEARQIVKHGINVALKPYMSKRVYYKLKLGIIK